MQGPDPCGQPADKGLASLEKLGSRSQFLSLRLVEIAAKAF